MNGGRPTAHRRALAAVARALGEHRLVNGTCCTCEPIPAGDDYAVRSLIAALDEVERTRYVRTPAGAKRYGLPIGSPIGGGASAPVKARRRPLQARLVDAVQSHLDGDNGGDPFAGFDREQLRRVAKARGIALRRGEPRESIAAKLLDDVRGGRKATAEPASILVRGRDRRDEIARSLHGRTVEYEGRRRKAYDSPIDLHLQEIVQTQGFDAKPQVVTAVELDRAVAAGWIETWRGVMDHEALEIRDGKPVLKDAKSAADINEQLRFGEFEPGRGVYGNGVYTSVRRNTAETFRGVEPKTDRPAGGKKDFGPEDLEGDPGPDSLLRFAIDPAARTGDFDELRAEMMEWQKSVERDSPEYAVFADVGRYAAAKGIDVMVVRKHEDGGYYPGWETDYDTYGVDSSHEQADQYVILNRSAVMIQRKEDPP